MLVGCGCVGVGVWGGLCVQTVWVTSDGVEGDSDSDSDKKNGCSDGHEPCL